MGAAAIQQRVARAFKRDGTPPPDGEAAGLAADLAEAAAEFVESVQIVNGRIELRFGRSADAAIMGSVLSLTPFETAEQDVVWVCGNRAPGVGLQPLGFMGGAAPSDAGVDDDRPPLPAARPAADRRPGDHRKTSVGHVWISVWSATIARLWSQARRERPGRNEHGSTEAGRPRAERKCRPVCRAWARSGCGSARR